MENRENENPEEKRQLGEEELSQVSGGISSIEEHLEEIRKLKRRNQHGVLPEVRKREFYEKPSEKRKKKSEAARKRRHLGDISNSPLFDGGEEEEN